jgi:hypothetical protein
MRFIILVIGLLIIILVNLIYEVFTYNKNNKF